MFPAIARNIIIGLQKYNRITFFGKLDELLVQKIQNFMNYWKLICLLTNVTSIVSRECLSKTVWIMQSYVESSFYKTNQFANFYEYRIALSQAEPNA